MLEILLTLVAAATAAGGFVVAKACARRSSVRAVAGYGFDDDEPDARARQSGL